MDADREIGEEIKWNAPAFFYTGAMRRFNPKEHKRHIVVFNLHRKDCIRLVFPSGARIGDTSGLLEGDYHKGRRLAFFSSTADVQFKKAALQEVVQKWLMCWIESNRGLPTSPQWSRPTRVEDVDA